MKKLLTFGAGALLVTALALPAFAEQPPVPDGPIKMELTKKPVMFDHGIHTAQQCVTCHPTIPSTFLPWKSMPSSVASCVTISWTAKNPLPTCVRTVMPMIPKISRQAVTSASCMPARCRTAPQPVCSVTMK